MWVRNDQSTLAKQQWHYCILDEGHVIKNAKAKLTKAVKTVQAHHRPILSGTPIQNNVLELWSLFDFLMPGFLGTRRFQWTVWQADHLESRLKVVEQSKGSR